MHRGARLTAYVSIVALAGALALVYAFPRVNLLAALVYGAVFFVTESTSSKLRDDVMISLGNLVVLVAILDQGAAVAIVATLGAAPRVVMKASDQRWLRLIFNTGQLAVAAAAASGAYAGVLAVTGARFPDPTAVLAIAVAAIVYVSVNYLLVGFVVALASGEPLRSAWRSVFQIGWLQGPYVGISILAAALLRAGAVGPLLLVLLALPVIVARAGLVSFERTDEAYDRLVRAFVGAIELKDRYTRGHSERVATLSVHVAEELGIPYDARRLTGYAALLHDVGKIGVPGCIINKPGALDEDEFAVIKRHPTIGAEILRDIDFLDPVLDIVRYHHERLDGLGYPHGLAADELSELVRIVTAVDAFDAMTSTRSYRRAWAVEDAVAELRRCAGSQFDPRMVEALATVVVRLEWKPTVEFASAPAPEVPGPAVPNGTAADRLRTGGDR